MDQNPFEPKNSPIPELNAPKNQPSSNDLRTLILRSLVSVSILIVIILAIVAIIKFLPQGLSAGSSISSYLSSFFQPKEQLVLSAIPQPVISGDTVTISINHIKKDPSAIGAYSFTYPCTAGFNFEVPNSKSKNDILPCAQTIFHVDASPLKLITISTNNKSVTVPVTVSYTLQGSSTPRVSNIISITAVKKTSSTTAQNPVTPITIDTTSTNATTTIKVPVLPPLPTFTDLQSAPSVVAQTGPADLSVNIIAVGVLDPWTNAFIPRPAFGPQDRVAIRFIVANRGSHATGRWQFKADFPS